FDPSSNSGPERYRCRQLDKQLSASPTSAADPLFGAAWGDTAVPRPARPWSLPVVSGLAIAAIIAAVSFRIWTAHPPVGRLRADAVLIGAVLGLGALWIYAVTQLMVSLSAVTLWTLVLVGLGMLAYLTTRSLDRELGAQVERQSSLLATLSDLGEGLVVTENGRFIAGNDSY